MKLIKGCTEEWLGAGWLKRWDSCGSAGRRITGQPPHLGQSLLITTNDSDVTHSLAECDARLVVPFTAGHLRRHRSRFVRVPARFWGFPPASMN